MKFRTEILLQLETEETGRRIDVGFCLTRFSSGLPWFVFDMKSGRANEPRWAPTGGTLKWNEMGYVIATYDKAQ